MLRFRFVGYLPAMVCPQTLELVLGTAEASATVTTTWHTLFSTAPSNEK